MSSQCVPPQFVRMFVVIGIMLSSTLFTASAAADELVMAVDQSHPFSDPTWLPIRNTTRISCVKSNPGCTPETATPAIAENYHGYWAIDFLGHAGDPVYPAGAGIVHTPTGTAQDSCSENSQATWVWVDHGGGKVSRYHHVVKGAFTDGQYVTPTTQIATIADCNDDYLHFEVRANGVLSEERINPGQLFACEVGAKNSYPLVFGFQSWNSLEKVKYNSPSADASCFPVAVGTPTQPLNFKTARANKQATVTWSAPSSNGDSAVTQYVIQQEEWSPSLSKWNFTEYFTVPVSTTKKVFTVRNGRSYRYRVLATNEQGNSAWTKNKSATAPPLTPKVARWLEGGRTFIRYAWWEPETQGTPITGYTLALRRKVSDGWTAWKYTDVGPHVVSYRKWTGLKLGSTYEVKVKVNSAAGSSAWSTTKSVKVPK